MDLLAIDRWLHVLSGITWVGLLYYFNFVQLPALARAKADGTAAGIVRHVAPRALLWFRWAAVATWVTGAVYLVAGHSTPEMNGFWRAFGLQGTAAPIGIGAWLGTIMLINVWVVIWPNQKRVLGMVEAADDDKARAARVALLASRINVVLSLPMLWFMIAGSAAHFGMVYGG
jgi:uncharacterized membrane protein